MNAQENKVYKHTRASRNIHRERAEVKRAWRIAEKAHGKHLLCVNVCRYVYPIKFAD